MKDGILKVVRDFIGERLEAGRPLLLGFSGGPDSLALLYLLLECRQFFPLDLHLAHMDHGWREESRAEAESLAALAGKLGLPFYLETLTPFAKQGNAEAQARKARLQFFLQLYQERGYQALLLAHHADDVAETVLKRVLEGSSIFAIGGLNGSSVFQGMQVFRPLLKVRKKDLIQWLAGRGLEGIQDSTNVDPKYLRSRMRTQIFPDLAEAFGKEIAMNLVRLGDTCQELQQYLYRKTEALLSHVIRAPSRIFIDLNPFLPIEKLEFMALCKQMLEVEKVLFSHAILENAYQALDKKQACRKFIHHHWEMSVDRGRLTVFNRRF